MSSSQRLLAFAATAVLVVLVLLVLVLQSTTTQQEERGDNKAADLIGRLPSHEGDSFPPDAFGASNYEGAAMAAQQDQIEFLTEIPAEWEDELGAILLEKEQPISIRNSRLLELATNQAAQVPRVQQECLMHLAFGLPNEDQDSFFAVCSSPKIPESLRKRFLDQVLAIRPTNLCVPLCERILQLGEPGLSAIAQDYLNTVAEEAATR